MSSIASSSEIASRLEKAAEYARPEALHVARYEVALHGEGGAGDLRLVVQRGEA